MGFLLFGFGITEQKGCDQPDGAPLQQTVTRCQWAGTAE